MAVSQSCFKEDDFEDVRAICYGLDIIAALGVIRDQ